jgi:hypothetical protein
VATKWDDDDVVRPPSTPNGAPEKPGIKVDVDAWHAKMKAATKAPPPMSERSQPPPTVITTATAPPKEPAPPAQLSDAEAERLAIEARRSAEAVLHRAGAKRKVRLRVKVSGWYPGSVPAVDFCDGAGHHFASAPRNPPETHDEYMRYWRAPFVAHLKKLGFDVIEDDV